jgi:Txe/YoeB family toxin of toxin-antitoxin system
MASWKLIYDKSFRRDEVKLIRAGLGAKIDALINIIKDNPFANPPSYEKLKGHTNLYSRRIDIKHRLEYEVNKTTKTVRVLRMWTHYGDN